MPTRWGGVDKEYPPHGDPGQRNYMPRPEWKATDPKSGLVCSVQEVMGDESNPTDVTDRVAAVKGLQHPHIVQLVDFFRTESLAKWKRRRRAASAGHEPWDHLASVPPPLFLVWATPEGLRLNKVVERAGRLDELVTRRYVRQIISALEHAHAHGTIHGTLGARSVIIDRFDNAQVMDFDRDNYQPDDSMLRGTCSVVHLAPERVEGKTQSVCAATDVYSLGVLIYFMLGGRFPFAGGSVMALLMQILQATPVFPPHLSLAARRLLGRMLLKDPEARPGTAEVLSDPWLAPEEDRAASCMRAPLPSG
eukprot:TRINITY_DN4270_c0_g1_i1.p1 TRINITY_DN4270_c0_g1~~TRINITY_DN4270_c0_g1_i1.p1  ORF type:complete len:307 (+),score=84.85 TRINITY_DN4270_c0_g1_i1:182-1102(+)